MKIASDHEFIFSSLEKISQTDPFVKRLLELGKNTIAYPLYKVKIQRLTLYSKED